MRQLFWLYSPITIALVVGGLVGYLTLGREADPVLVAAGDIARCGSPGAEATAKLLDSMPSTLITLGDNAYESGTATEFVNCYGPTWGRYKALISRTLAQPLVTLRRAIIAMISAHGTSS